MCNCNPVDKNVKLSVIIAPKMVREHVYRRHFAIRLFFNSVLGFLESRETELWVTGEKDPNPKEFFCRYVFF